MEVIVLAEMPHKGGQPPLFDERPDILGEAQDYYARNPELLNAHIRASEVMQRIYGKSSARFLTEMARWGRFLGTDGLLELIDCYSGVLVDGDDSPAVPNSTSAYLTRVLDAHGHKVTKARSRMDER